LIHKIENINANANVRKKDLSQEKRDNKWKPKNTSDEHLRTTNLSALAFLFCSSDVFDASDEVVVPNLNHKQFKSRSATSNKTCYMIESNLHQFTSLASLFPG